MIPTKHNPIGMMYPKEDVSAFKIRITSADVAASEAYLTFGVSSYTPFVIDWGDGSSTSASGGGNFTHAYSASGTYVVRIGGTSFRFLFTGTGVTPLKVIEAIKLKSTITSGQYGFFNCSNLRVAQGFRAHSGIVNLDFFFANCGLGGLPLGFSIPATSLSNIEMLYGNPDLAFDIENFFPDWPAGSTVNLTEICYYDAHLTGAAPASKLWERTDITWISAGAFAGCTGLSNYADIPAGWK